jgi:phosphatidylglycerophosphate synthase/GTP:adenosylcobinamide-phosphate guanylyltransferase
LKFLIEIGHKNSPFTKLCGITLLDRTYRTIKHAVQAEIYLLRNTSEEIFSYMENSNYEFKKTDNIEKDFIIISTDTVFNMEYIRSLDGVLSSRKPFIMPINIASDLLKAESKLIEDCKKSGEGYITYLTRLVSLQISKYLCRTKITPNQITAARIPVFILASIFIAYNLNYATYFIGLVGHILCATVFDAIDGDVARLKLQFSKQGEWMDMANDIIASILFTLSIAILNSNLNHTYFDNILNIAVPTMFIIANLMMIHILFRNYAGGGFLSVMYDFSKNSVLKTIISEPVRRDTAILIVCIIAMFYLTRTVLIMNGLMSLGIFIYYGIVISRPKTLVSK